MTRSTVIGRALIATLALAALGLAAATPASAHTDNLYGHIDYDAQTEGQAFAAISKADAAITPLAPSDQVFNFINGMELVNEVGTAIGMRSTDDANLPVVTTWNHATGTFSDPIVMFIEGAAQFFRASGLTARADGTLLTYVTYVAAGQDEAAIAIVDPDSGEVTPVIDTLAFSAAYPYFFSELVSDPVTGADFALLRSQTDGRPAYVPLDVAGHAIGVPVPFGGTDFALAEFGGADIAADGTLYFVLSRYDEEPLDLARLGSPSTWATANPVVIGEYGTDDLRMDFGALTTEYLAPALANTGSDAPALTIVLLGAAAVLAGGLTVMVARRRVERGTV